MKSDPYEFVESRVTDLMHEKADQAAARRDARRNPPPLTQQEGALMRAVLRSMLKLMDDNAGAQENAQIYVLQQLYEKPMIDLLTKLGGYE